VVRLAAIRLAASRHAALEAPRRSALTPPLLQVVVLKADGSSGSELPLDDEFAGEPYVFGR